MPRRLAGDQLVCSFAGLEKLLAFFGRLMLRLFAAFLFWTSSRAILPATLQSQARGSEAVMSKDEGMDGC
jgi:hypothetical protein